MIIKHIRQSDISHQPAHNSVPRLPRRRNNQSSDSETVERAKNGGGRLKKVHMEGKIERKVIEKPSENSGEK